MTIASQTSTRETPADTDPGAGRRLHLIGVLLDEVRYPRCGAIHCTLTDDAITCTHDPEGSIAPLIYPADDAFGRALVELMDSIPPGDHESE